MAEDDTPAPREERDETPAERLDRNWSELLQELRVTQTGLQILSGFLLMLPFQARFAELDPVLRGVYLATFVLATLATCLIIAPVTAHRLLFRRHVKDRLVTSSDLMAKIGLALLALALVLAVVLVFGFVVDLTAALVAGLLTLGSFVALWVVVPLRLGRDRDRTRPYR